MLMLMIKTIIMVRIHMFPFGKYSCLLLNKLVMFIACKLQGDSYKVVIISQNKNFT